MPGTGGRVDDDKISQWLIYKDEITFRFGGLTARRIGDGEADSKGSCRIIDFGGISGSGGSAVAKIPEICICACRANISGESDRVGSSTAIGCIGSEVHHRRRGHRYEVVSNEGGPAAVVILHHEGHIIGPGRLIGVGGVGIRAHCPVAKVPRPANDIAIGRGGGIGKLDCERTTTSGAVNGECWHWILKDGDIGRTSERRIAPRGCIGDREGDRISPRIDIGGGRVGQGGSVSIAEIPKHDIVWPCGEIGESHG